MLICMEDAADVSGAIENLRKVYSISSRVLSATEDTVSIKVPNYKRQKESLWTRHAENMILNSVVSVGKSSQTEFITDWNNSIESLVLEPDTDSTTVGDDTVVFVDPSYEHNKKLVGFKREYANEAELRQLLFELRGAINEHKPVRSFKAASRLNNDVGVSCSADVNLVKFPKLKALYKQAEFSRLQKNE